MPRLSFLLFKIAPWEEFTNKCGWQMSQRRIHMMIASSFVSLKYILIFILIRDISWGKGVLKTLSGPIFSGFPSSSVTPCLLLASPHPSRLWGDEWRWHIFWGNVGGLQSISYLMWAPFTRGKKKNNNTNTLPAKLDGSSMHWLLKSYCITLWGDSTPGTARGLWGPMKRTLPFLKNIPSGNNLAFPAKHELAWQSDQLIAAVHLIPHAWLITITSPRT